MTIQRVWSKRTTSERTSAIIIAVGCAFFSVLAIWGQESVKSGGDFAFYLGALAFGALFLVCAVPAALAILVLGGTEFASPWRRTLDKVLPLFALALLFVILAGL